MKGTTNAQRNAVVSSTYSGNTLKLTYADGKSDSHTLAAPVTVDSALSSTSTNPVQNKVVNSALAGKVDKVSGKGLSTNDYTPEEKTKVSNLPDNANDTFATKTELTSAVSSVYKYKGTKATYADLPSSGNTTGDVWNVTASHGNVPAGTNWAWNGSAWDALGGEIDLSGYVPTSRKVNGKALSGDITLAASDVSAVPTTRTVNKKALSANISLTASDVGALASNGTAVKATADASGNNIVNTYATKTELTNGLAGKQNALTFDSAPTSGSSNPVTSGGVYSAINSLSKGEVWEEVDLSNFPTDWVGGDRIKVCTTMYCIGSEQVSGTGSASWTNINEFMVSPNLSFSSQITIFDYDPRENKVNFMQCPSANNLNNGIFLILGLIGYGTSTYYYTAKVTSAISKVSNALKIWRLKK